MAAVHPQPPQDSMPPGWECRYDPRTGRHYFLNHLEHITTWEDPRVKMSSIQQAYPPYYGSGNYAFTVTSPPPPPLITSPPPITNGSGGYYTGRMYTQGQYTEGYSSPKTPYRFRNENFVNVDEDILMKLCVQFPTVEEGHIWQLLKQYHNRENVVVSALLAEGQPRAQTFSIETTPKLQRSDMQSFQPDEALFHKLRNFFPAAEERHIRSLLRIYNNQEHEVISALVSGNRGYNSRHQSPHNSSPLLKLRFLKLVFPECDEAILFNVLWNSDNNAQEASTRLLDMGYSKKDAPVTRPSSAPVRRPSLQYPPPTPEKPRPTLVMPPNASGKIQLVSKLQEQFPAVSRTLVNMALDTSNYNEERAKQFLAAMTPQDATRTLVPVDLLGREPDKVHVDGGKESPPIPPPRSRHASASQESESPKHSSLERQGDISKEGTPSISPRHYVISGSPAHKATSPVPESKPRPKFKKEVQKISKATSTHSDFENMSIYRTQARGPDPSLRKGPSESLLLKEYQPWKGPDPKNRKGPDSSLRKGPDPKNLSSRLESRAKGPQRSLIRGPLAALKLSSNIPSPEGNAEDSLRSS